MILNRFNWCQSNFFLKWGKFELSTMKWSDMEVFGMNHNLFLT